jgi:(1->4)-alpha-D-glucan 1-alpha-D-glucosylmutase
VEHWEDGRVKLYAIHRALRCRRAHPELFRRGSYLPLATEGRHAPHVCAYARSLGGEVAVVIVPRLTARLTGHGVRLPLGRELWDDTCVVLPPELAGAAFTDVYTGHAFIPGEGGSPGTLMVGRVLTTFPVALLAPARCAREPGMEPVPGG